MKKISTLLLIISLFAFFAGRGLVIAKEKREIPEVEGIYNDPEHAGVKVRVFVHKEKPARSVNSSLICGLSDADSSALVNAAGWHLSSSWTYNLNTSNVPASVGSSNLPTFTNTALTNWSGASGSKVVFSRGADTNTNRQAYDGRNIIAWGSTQGSALAVTYIRYIPSTGQTVDVDTIMNKKWSWSWTNQSTNPTCALSNTYDAQDILTHELGHWMGLDDEYTNSYVDNTMYGYGSKAEVKKDTLSTGDVNGVSAIYSSF